MKMRILFAVESHILASQFIKTELCKVGHSAKQPHCTNEDTKGKGHITSGGKSRTPFS
jgi:CDGSH-type Zn-finger protein